jgi:hypothetical protein
MQKTTEWPTRNNYVQILLRSQTDWDATVEFTRAVLQEKEKEERNQKKKKVYKH